MNSRSGVNERNLVNYSADLSTINQLDSKDGLLSFPFDHIYACHSQGGEIRQPLQLDKEVEISTYCMSVEDKNLPAENSEISKLKERLSLAANQNKKLRTLLIYHLDLMQQQNDIITKKEKSFHALKQENDTLKAKLLRMDTSVIGLSPRHRLALSAPTATVTSNTAPPQPVTKERGVCMNSFADLIYKDQGNKIVDKNKPSYAPEIFGIARINPEPAVATETPVTYNPAEIKVPPTLDKKLNSDKPKMIESKRTVKTDTRAETLYNATCNSGTSSPRKQRNRRRKSGVGSRSRGSKKPKTEQPESGTANKTDDDPTYETKYSLNKKARASNTYTKRKRSTSIKTPAPFVGSLSDRLQLIDTTPTGEDPYCIGEAEMREQSPIPKLMLQKTSHRMNSSSIGETSRQLFGIPDSSTNGIVSPFNDPKIVSNKSLLMPDPGLATPSQIFDLPDPSTSVNGIMSPFDEPKALSNKTLMIPDPDLEMVKTESGINWQVFEKPEEPNTSDFSYGEGTNNLDSILPSLDANEFEELFSGESALNTDNFGEFFFDDKLDTDKTKKTNNRTTSLVSQEEEESTAPKRGNGSRRGRKRAFSATGLGKQPPKERKATKPKAVRGRGAARGKKSPPPGLVTDKPYPTLVGDPDVSWYLGLDPELKPEDVDPPADSQASTVEVPRWREKPYTCIYTMEGTENLDDKVFEKRHQKLEAEERRQLRWHMRRIREQRHVERLKQRQRDSWSSTVNPPTTYTVWPRPVPDVRFIEITDELPVTSMGEPLPQLAENDFVLPWVRTSKAQKRSKRSKTLH